MARAIKLINAPVGLFDIDGVLVLKTEYSTQHEDGAITPDCYIVDSGEYFWGGVDSVEERNNLMVTPIDMPTLTPPNEWIGVKDRLPEDEKPVLAYYGFYHDDSNEDLGARYIGTLTYFTYDPEPHWQHESTGLFVTHWMPLPEPPEE